MSTMLKPRLGVNRVNLPPKAMVGHLDGDSGGFTKEQADQLGQAGAALVTAIGSAFTAKQPAPPPPPPPPAVPTWALVAGGLAVAAVAVVVARRVLR